MDRKQSEKYCDADSARPWQSNILLYVLGHLCFIFFDKPFYGEEQ